MKLHVTRFQNILHLKYYLANIRDHQRPRLLHSGVADQSIYLWVEDDLGQIWLVFDIFAVPLVVFVNGMVIDTYHV